MGRREEEREGVYLIDSYMMKRLGQEIAEITNVRNSPKYIPGSKKKGVRNYETKGKVYKNS